MAVITINDTFWTPKIPVRSHLCLNPLPFQDSGSIIAREGKWKETNALNMLYKILADIIVIVHLLWILFMLVGFILTLRGFFWKGFFDRWLFRTLHLFGIAYVGLLAIMGKYCPLTLWEYSLREKYDSTLTYPGSFMIYYAERLVYPDINPLIILIPTTFIAIFTVVVFIIRPPKRIKEIFK